jgi:hypothetical protein
MLHLKNDHLFSHLLHFTLSQCLVAFAIHLLMFISQLLPNIREAFSSILNEGQEEIKLVYKVQGISTPMVNIIAPCPHHHKVYMICCAK